MGRPRPERGDPAKGPLPLSLLKTAQNHPMLVELKNGETYNGHLVSCDNWMNINLREVICTSRGRKVQGDHPEWGCLEPVGRCPEACHPRVQQSTRQPILPLGRPPGWFTPRQAKW
ncbi:U6 snRNA-associated Sm-like protein LSm4 isoform X5 [Prionailurus viverrinus]|uniref:U6 snRNA-associated Sm-like protein LSm4 isoform X5 n=1 Tax=Prionailurus viverrinus TaxID=61388 RepID=UPI001FF3AE66|nr:U6 snRNA-associated Sm-like protein LSm4 isoform X5 [Prionailurus viverrinus]